MTVRVRYAMFGTSHWSAALDMPSGVQYSIHQVREQRAHGDGAPIEPAPVHTGTMMSSEPGHAVAVFPPTNLQPGEQYEVPR